VNLCEVAVIGMSVLLSYRHTQMHHEIPRLSPGCGVRCHSPLLGVAWCAMVVGQGGYPQCDRILWLFSEYMCSRGAQQSILRLIMPMYQKHMGFVTCRMLKTCFWKHLYPVHFGSNQNGAEKLGSTDSFM